MEALSGQATGIVYKNPDFQQDHSPMQNYFLAAAAMRGSNSEGGR
jgi:hypothetical protein